MNGEEHQSPVVEAISVEEPTVTTGCAMEQPSCTAPVCSAAPCGATTSCAMPSTSCTMPCNYNQYDNNFSRNHGHGNHGHVGFRESIRNMFRHRSHSESSCSTYNGHAYDYNNCNPCETQACEPVCQPCEPVCQPCEPVCKPCPQPVMKKGYKTEQYQVTVPYDKKIKVACQVPSFENKVICKQVQCYKTKYVPTKVPYCKNVKETIKVPTTKTIYKTQTQKCYRTETKSRKVPYWYCEEPKCPEPVCSPCEPTSCNPCETQQQCCDYNHYGSSSNHGMRKRDRFMQSIRRPFDHMDNRFDSMENRWDNSRLGRKWNEFEDSYDNRWNSRASSHHGGSRSRGFWKSFGF